MTWRVFSVLLALCIVPVLDPAEARVWHVDCDRGSDSASGSETEPFKTILRASNVLKPGDTVVIREGVYHEQIVGGNSGQEGAPITYEGMDRGKVVMQGSVRVKDWQQSEKVWTKGGLKPITQQNSFVMVDEKRMLKKVDSASQADRGCFHLAPDGVYTIRLWEDSNPNTDHDIDVYEYDFAFNSGDRWDGTAKKWIILRNMTLEKYGVNGISTDAEHPADNSRWELDRLTVRFNRAEGIFYCLDDWYVHDCEFIRNGVHGCQINGARVRFFNNLCAENEWFGVSGDGGCGLLIGPDDSAHSSDVSNNVFADNGDGLGYGCGVYLEGRARNNLIHGNQISGGTSAGICFFGSSHNRVVNNVIVNVAPQTDWENAAAFVLHHSLEGAPTKPTGNLIAHNTVWGCPSPVFVEDPGVILEKKDYNRFVNNLFAMCRFLSPIPGSPGVTFDSNAWYGCPDGEKIDLSAVKKWLKGFAPVTDRSGANDLDSNPVIVADPVLQDTSRGNFRPGPDSPLIDAGANLGEISRDKDGNLRPVGSGPDIGAYEVVPERK
ncbi:MAG: right-handed parallel beta-helix repeat-containing protein [Desulfomonile tiedjei]|uniref:Right-handed parallel beta-helix repeat-containing protein n=1 Tax=Desulfomonile tiedjei TaxID=2358 RepID=A0A9D6Z200_9BACT|nr:right-handed parallel beta-helix repeat-containing protein [Desulfomonile tiedjei]